MLAIERKQQIIALLRENKKVIVADLSKQFDVTEETIRRDLKNLESSGFVIRNRGGAVLESNFNLSSLSFVERETVNYDAKLHVALIAEQFIEDGMTIMVDTATTSKIVVQNIHPKKNITIITNSHQLISECIVNQNLTFIATGGSVDSYYKAYVGRDAIKVIEGYNVDFAILGCNSISKKFGFMESNSFEADVKIAMSRHAKRTMIVTDSSKLDKESLVRTFAFNEVHQLILDKAPIAEWLNIFNNYNIKLNY